LAERKEKGKKEGNTGTPVMRAPKRNPDQKLVGKSLLHGFHTGFASLLPSFIHSSSAEIYHFVVIAFAFQRPKILF
jgi:hypothetical protein